MNQEIVSLFIPIIVIVLAMITKRIIAGGIFLASGNVIDGCIVAIEHVVKSATNRKTYTH